MPWQCTQCNTAIDDDVVKTCPGCGHAKTSWTMVKEQTRKLRVGLKKFVCERGTDESPVAAPRAETYDAAVWVATEVAPAIPTAEARRLAGAGQGPSPKDVLRVVLHPGGAPPSPIELTTLPEARRSATSEHEARRNAPHDARFLLVFGEPPDGLSFEGLTVVDVTDDRPEGHAPHLEVVALRRPVQKLAIEPASDLDWSLFGLDLEDEPVDWTLFGLDVEHEAPAEADVDWSLFGLDVEHPQEDLDWSLFGLDAHADDHHTDLSGA